MRARLLLAAALPALALAAAPPAFAGPDPTPSPASPEERPGMVYIPAGDFMMGSTTDDPLPFDFEKKNEQPQHKVWLDAYYIDRHEVTNAAFAAFNPGHLRDPRSACEDCPVTLVSWGQAQAFCASQSPPKRLPTEAEWEKAAKGGQDKRPEPLGDYAWYEPNADGAAHPVAQKKPNPYGLYDVLGNVREWTADWFETGYYDKSPARNPKGPDTGTRKVERGGAFFMLTRSVTVNIRYNHPPTFSLYFLGFRCAETP